MADEHGYSLLNFKTGEIILQINFTAINEDLDGKVKISKEEAVEKASEFCGKDYILVRVTENPYDYDIL